MKIKALSDEDFDTIIHMVFDRYRADPSFFPSLEQKNNEVFWLTKIAIIITLEEVNKFLQENRK